jgi:threonine dehydrogenase-like Zn-dependent dehydrogenase
VTLAGLCGTDYRIWTGDRPVGYPRVLGHEFVGAVAAVGEGVSRARVGDRVAVEPNYSCGRCPLCREGNRNLCLSRTAVGIDVDGCFAEMVRVPERCCWPAPAGVADEDLMITEPLAVVVRAVARSAVTRGENAAVVGAGTLGLLALQVLRGQGARVLVVSRSSRRFTLAGALGAEATHAVADGPLDAVAHAFSGREGVDVVVETAGTAEAVSHALALDHRLDDLPGRVPGGHAPGRRRHGTHAPAGDASVRSRRHRRGIRGAPRAGIDQGRRPAAVVSVPAREKRCPSARVPAKIVTL